MQTLKDSELRYRRLFEAAQDGILILDAVTGMIEDVNPYLIKMLGYSREEFVEKKLWEVGAFRDIEASKDAFEALQENEYIRYEDMPLKTKDGHLVDVEFVSNVYSVDGEKVIQCNIRNITERKQAEEQLRSAGEFLQNVQDALSAHIAILDYDGNIIQVNSAWRNFGAQNGLSHPNHCIGMNYLDICDSATGPCSDEAAVVANAIREVRSGKKNEVKVEYPCHAPNEQRWFVARIASFENNKKKWVMVAHENITVRQQTDIKIQQYVLEMETLYENGLILGQLLSQKKIGEKLIELLERKMEWHHTAIRLYHPQSETLELLAFNQPDVRDEKQYGQVAERFNTVITHPGEGFTGWVVQNAQVVRSNTVNQDPRYKETYSNMQCGIYVPMISGQNTIGVISIESEKPDAFSDADERLLVTLANQAAVAIENAQLFQIAQLEIMERKRFEILLADEKNQLAQRVKERTADLNHANLDLATALRVKDEFLASMSHELRTPLTSILGFSEALQLNVYGKLNTRQEKTIRIIEESGRHLLALINDILDLAKIGADKLELQFAPCSVAEICRASLELTKGLANQKHQTVHYVSPTEPIIVRADARRLKQILVNLLSNAIKFTPENSEIGLEIQENEAEKNIKFIIWDKGIGIKPEDMRKLFMPFMQIDNSLAREYSGTGLGLSLVKRLAELHNGSIEMESKFGEGSTFTLILPWSPHNTSPVLFTTPLGLDKTANSATLSDHSNLPIILIADDNEMILQMISDFLESNHYLIVKVRSGFELLERVAEVHPDVMLVDIQMAGMDGLETIRRIRSHVDKLIAATPVVAVTALAMPGDRERCLQSGANEYISKPVRLADLTAIINDLIEKK